MVGIIINRSSDREADHKIIEQGMRNSDPNMRRQASHARDRLMREDGRIRSMREALIKAHRNKDKGEIADIHDRVSRDRRYKNV